MPRLRDYELVTWSTGAVQLTASYETSRAPHRQRQSRRKPWPYRDRLFNRRLSCESATYPADVPTPQFVLDLRARIGHDPLPLPSVTAVVFDDDSRVLLVRRADNGQWALVTGCLEPGEQPAAGAVREIAEETGVVAAAEHLLGVSALPLRACPNGDQVHWLDTAFRCRLVSGEAHVGDDESVDVGWFAVDQLPDIPPRHRECIEHAVSPEPAARFRLA